MQTTNTLTVTGVLERIRGKSIFFEPVGGNNGDTVIELGARELFQRLGIRVQRDQANADVILINGNASMAVELYDKNLGGVEYYAQTFSDKPLILLPSSFYFQGNRLGNCFRGRSAPAFLFARECYSYARLQEQTFPSEVQVGLDHDMAFQLVGSELIRSLKSRVTAKYILLVERFDAEAATGGTSQEVRAPRRFKRALPAPVKNLVKKIIHTRRAARTGFATTILQRLYAEAPQYQGLPIFAHDISSPVGFTLEQFTQAILDAAVVVTTRLHVGILAALLEKPTYLYTGSAPYPKIKGIYEYSMAEMPHVHLW